MIVMLNRRKAILKKRSAKIGRVRGRVVREEGAERRKTIANLMRVKRVKAIILPM
ncbi:hypothetical protein S83_067199, partial [Arachis hypogaea]